MNYLIKIKYLNIYLGQCMMPSELPCCRCIVIILWQDLFWFEGKKGIWCILLLFEQDQEYKTLRKNVRAAPGGNLKVNWNTTMTILLDDTSVCLHRANTKNKVKLVNDVEIEFLCIQNFQTIEITRFGCFYKFIAVMKVKSLLQML